VEKPRIGEEMLQHAGRDLDLLGFTAAAGNRKLQEDDLTMLVSSFVPPYLTAL